VRALIARHIEAGGEMSRLEGIGASNFFDLDDISLCDEGEPLDPKSIISLPIANGRPQLPNFKDSPETLLLRQVNDSGRKWVVVVGDQGQPMFVLDAHRFLRGAFFGASKQEIQSCFHRPIVITDTRATLDVIGRLTVDGERSGDDVIDDDVIVVWTNQRGIITGADLLGRLLRGIAKVENKAA
jgi:metal transporter CNNM